MLKNNLQSKIEILIIGGASKIARQAFKKNNEYDVVGFSKFSKVNQIKEYKLIKYNNVSSIKNILKKLKIKKLS